MKPASAIPFLSPRSSSLTVRQIFRTRYSLCCFCCLSFCFLFRPIATFLCSRCKGHFVFERLGGARTSLAAYNTKNGASLKQLPVQASNDGISSVSAAHPRHGVSPRSLRPGRQTPAPAAISAPCRCCRVWNACRRSWRNSSGLCE